MFFHFFRSFFSCNILKITTCAIFYFALTAVVEGKLFPTRLETAKEDDGIEYGWLIVIPEDETAATGGKPAAIEGADDEADETGGDGGVELRTSDKEVAWPVSLKKRMM